MVTEFTSGQMVASLKVIGRTITCTARASTPGLMDAVTKVNMKTTKSTGKVFTPGAMEDSTAVNGSMENSTAKECIGTPTVTVEPAFGRRESVLCGSTVDPAYF